MTSPPDAPEPGEGGGVEGGAGPTWPPGDAGGTEGRRRRKSRLVLWVSLSIAAALAVFVAVLATSGPAQQQEARSPLIGKPAPVISGPNLLGGRTVTLSAFAGKWVLVNFAASWCVPCRLEMPQLSAFEHDGAGRGDAALISVADDPMDYSNLAKLMRSQRADWPVVDDGQAPVDYGVVDLPESYLVDPAGTVVAKYYGQVVASQIIAEISKLSLGTT